MQDLSRATTRLSRRVTQRPSWLPSRGWQAAFRRWTGSDPGLDSAEPLVIRAVRHLHAVGSVVFAELIDIHTASGTRLHCRPHLAHPRHVLRVAGPVGPERIDADVVSRRDAETRLRLARHGWPCRESGRTGSMTLGDANPAEASTAASMTSPEMSRMNSAFQ